MNVFISWSKEPSKSAAKALSDWLPTVINAIDPWMSEEDIPAGSRWNDRISAQLATTKFGIVCVTPQNQHAPWLQFESGALAKAVETARGSSTGSPGENYVCPYLIGMSSTSLVGPLTAFQGVEANRDGTLRLLKSINRALTVIGERALRHDKLEISFERAWGELETVLNNLPQEIDEAPQRAKSEILAEVLETVRDTNRKVQGLEFHNFVNRLAATLPYPINDLTPAIRSVILKGTETKLQEAVSEIQHRQEQLGEPEASFVFNTPQEVDIYLVSQSPSTFEDITTFIKKLASKYGITVKPWD